MKTLASSVIGLLAVLSVSATAHADHGSWRWRTPQQAGRPQWNPPAYRHYGYGRINRYDSWQRFGRPYVHPYARYGFAGYRDRDRPSYAPRPHRWHNPGRHLGW